jgi:hypothetical protein
MPTLRIEHQITGYPEWKDAFDSFAGMRAAAGVRRHTVLRPVDDDRYILIDLDFETTEQASRFAAVLRDRIWSSSDSSPALVGSPRTRILQTLDASDGWHQHPRA